MIRRTVGAMVLAGLTISAGGCALGAVPWWMAVTAPPEKVKAMYEPPQDSTVLVWINDNPANEITTAGSLRYPLTDALNKQLLEKKVVENVVDPQKVVSMQIANPDFPRMSVADVAKAVGADLVLHVEIAEFSLRDTPMNPLWHGKLTTYVQVLDCDGNLLWPEDRLDGYPVQPIEIKTSSEASAAYGTKLTQMMVLAEADRIARLLYDHEVDALDASRDRRLEDMDSQGLALDD